MLNDQLALIDALAGKEPKGRLRMFEYIVLIHPHKDSMKRDSTRLHDSGRILQVNEQCANAAVIAKLPQDLKDIPDRVEVGLRPF